jgi:hypothetical protein
MRIFLTLFPNSVTRTVLLVPCLLVCLACATPFPIEQLEPGITMSTVQEKFGPSAAAETDCLSYRHEKQDWFFTFHPLVPLFIPITVAFEGMTWSEAAHSIYIHDRMLLIDFEEGQLSGSEIIKPVSDGYSCTPSTYGPDPVNPGGMWVWSGGGCSNTYAPWPDPPTCTAVRDLYERLEAWRANR